MKNIGLIGAAGFVAPRHMKAIFDTGNRIVAAVDPHDSVGILDRYFPEARFFTEIERFDRHLERLRRERRPEQIDYLSVCSPNYLHDAHCRLGLRVRADVICEKPLTISPWNIDALAELEREFDRRIYTVLQLRLHPVLLALKKQLEAKPRERRASVCLSYVTPRGPWYQTSWKGDLAKSGGVATNIGVHFFDLLLWLFGPVERFEVHVSTRSKMLGFLSLQGADVTWFLSVDRRDLPPPSVDAGKAAFRSLTIDGSPVDFSEGFTDLHTAVYESIFAGSGFGLAEARPSIELADGLRNKPVSPRASMAHPELSRIRKELGSEGLAS